MVRRKGRTTPLCSPLDSITQAALGAVVGELVLGRKIGWKGAAWGALLGTVPDLDILLTPFGDAADFLRWHRGLSHSVLVMLIMPLLLARPLARLHRRHGVTPGEAGLLVFLVWSTHVLIDCFTSYGTQIWEPFSDSRFAFDNVFIIDLLFTAPMLLSLLVIFFHPPASRLRRTINFSALLLCCLYVALSFGMKAQATSKIRKAAEAAVPGGQLVAVTPTVSNVVLWRGLVETGDSYFVTYWSPFDKTPGSFNGITKGHELLAGWSGDKVAETLKWFAKGHWVAAPGEDGAILLAAMRMGEIRDPEAGIWRPVFQWELTPDEGSSQLKMRAAERPKMKLKEALGLVLQRIVGNRTRWEMASKGVLSRPDSSR